MSRMAARFAEMAARGEKILVSYFPIGDSCVADAAAWAGTFYKTGTTVLEIGLPYEDPVYDGPTVADSMARALSRTDLAGVFEDIRKIRAAYPDGIVQVMTYVENIRKYGFDEFARILAELDVDALLAANADPAEKAALDAALAPYGIDNLRFVPYHMTDEMIRDLQENASGYVYLQAVDGQTGSAAAITEQPKENAARLRAAGVNVPMIPGFGISTPGHVRTYLAMGLDGVVVGSAIIKSILAGKGEEYLRSLSEALREGTAARDGGPFPAEEPARDKEALLTPYLALDFDGTLGDSNGAFIEFSVEYARAYGKEITAGFIEEAKAMSISEFNAALGELTGNTAEQTKQAVNAFLTRYYSEEVELKPFVREFLEKQKAAGRRMVILSSTSGRYLRLAAAKLDLAQYFEEIITPELTGGKGKSKPEIYRYTIEHFGVSPEEITMFDDSLEVIRMADAAGMRTIGVYDEICEDTADEIKKICVKYIRGFDELL